MDGLLAWRIDGPGFLVPMAVVVLALGGYLLARRPWPRGLVVSAAAAVVGGGLGGLALWLAVDVWDVFGIGVKPATGWMVVMVGAGVGLTVANLVRTRWWRKIVAVLMIPAVLLGAGAGVNWDYGAYPTLQDALGLERFPTLPGYLRDRHAGPMDPELGSLWRPPAGMPTQGKVMQVRIPAPASHFAARRALVYLPPAALTAHPPVLPVVMLMAGQPGSPSDVFTSGQAGQDYNTYAAAHHGLAPIVVAPDQLGSPQANPMCVNSPLGNSATYLTKDVPDWVRAHLHVADSGRYWAVGGYSQGATCAVQFGAGRPDQFHAFMPVLSELAPTIGKDTVKVAFGGSQAAYTAATPLALLAAHAPYKDSMAIFGTGVQDTRYTGYAHTLVAAARQAGIHTRFIVAEHSGHDWITVRHVWSRGLPALADWMGLGR